MQMGIMAEQAGTGRTILVVEDEAIVAMLVEDILLTLGHGVAGPASTLAEARALVADGNTLDAALLDMNVAGESIFPFARELRGLGVPLIFASGYGQSGAPEEFRDCVIVQKLFTDTDIENALNRIFPAAES